MEYYKEALENNYGKGSNDAETITTAVAKQLAQSGVNVDQAMIEEIYKTAKNNSAGGKDYSELIKMIDELPKFGNDNDEVDMFARDV